MRTKIAGWIIIILGTVLALRTGFNVYRLWKTGDQVIEQQKAVEQAKKENEQLQKELAKAQDPNTIVKEAREKLGYGMPGETLVIIPEVDNDTEKKEKQEEVVPNWKKWWNLYIKI